MSRITDLKVKIFADGADYEGIVKMAKNPVIKGFTTNPTLMRKAGVNDYEAFARKVLAAIPDRPVSFEVFADDFASMAEQARAIAAWAPNVNVKIPVTNTKGQSASELLRVLSSEGVVLNVTAIFTLEQVRAVAEFSTVRGSRAGTEAPRPGRGSPCRVPAGGAIFGGGEGMNRELACWITGFSDCDCVRTEFTEHASRIILQSIHRITPFLHYSITPFPRRA